MPSRPLAKPREGITSGQIGVRDPFQLIRHLARSQSDPRKAVAELVQNALDEQASHVVMERWREAGEALISIRDDGKGVLPEMPRPEALRYIAKNIGYSRKRQLSFDERMRQAMLGQYGIGILGFWALGHEFRMISRVAGSEVWVLTLWEDSPKFEIEISREAIPGPRCRFVGSIRRRWGPLPGYGSARICRSSFEANSCAMPPGSLSSTGSRAAPPIGASSSAPASCKGRSWRESDRWPFPATRIRSSSSSSTRAMPIRTARK